MRFEERMSKIAFPKSITVIHCPTNSPTQVFHEPFPLTCTCSRQGSNSILVVQSTGIAECMATHIAANMEEQVLVVPTRIFHALGYFQGFCADVDHYRDILLDTKNVQFRPRNEVEIDPQFKQLIPYMIFCHTDSLGNISIFQYVRGKGMGESRLHQKRSIGIGGHIAAEDQEQHSADIYREGMLRELREEVVLHTIFTEQCVGLINDDTTEVGSVHLGIVHRLDVAEPKVVSNEPDLIESGFMPLDELQKHREQMESWSAISLDALF